MEDLKIEATQDSLAVTTNIEKGELTLAGLSYPENTVAFFKAIYSWLKSYFSSKDKIVLNCKIDYANTSSAKCLLELFSILDGYKAEGKSVSVIWYYRSDDEDMLEAGQEFEEDISIDFTFIAQEGN